MRTELDTVPVDDLIEEIQWAVQVANVSADGPSELRVTSIQLILNAVVAVGNGGKIDFRIPVVGVQLSVGRKVSRQDTHRIDVTLVPPSTAGHETRGSGVADVLVEAIGTIRTIMQRAASGETRFELESATVELSFVVTDLGIISLGIDGEFRDEVTHTIRLQLAPPDRHHPEA
jgi:Trypsin-co-occurring domain 2